MQAKFEDGWFKGQAEVESLGLDIQGYGGDIAIRGYLTEWCESQAEMVRSSWWEFLDYMMGKYRDGMRMTDVKVEMIKPTKLFYPRWWLELTGFWGSPGTTADEAKKNNEGEFEYELEWDKKSKHEKKWNDEQVKIHDGSTFDTDNAKKEESKKEEAKVEEADTKTEVLGAASPVIAASPPTGHGPVTLVFVAAIGAALGVFGKKYTDAKRGYTNIPL